MTSQRFTDALSGADGTQALRLRYDVPPVYPDATVPVAAVRPATVPVVAVRIPPIDPRVAAQVAERGRVTQPRVARAPAPARAVRAPAAPPPSRAQAARAGYYQGPVPTAVAPALPSQHRSFPALPSAPIQGAADRVRAQLAQFGTGNPRSQPAMPSSPQAGRRSSVPLSAGQSGRRSAEPASAFQAPAPPVRPLRQRSNGITIGLFVLLFVLVVTGLGAQLIDAVINLIDR